MEEDEDDDLYAPDESNLPAQTLPPNTASAPAQHRAVAKDVEDEEEGEEVEEDESDSDIDIITERKSDTRPETAQPSRTPAPNAPLNVLSPPADTTSAARTSPTVKVEPSSKETPTKPGSAYPAIKTSNIDVDAKPVYEPAGKPITEVDMDADFPEDDKPWRRPGTDMTDFFNYGFDEFTWANYCLKQNSLRKEVTDSKKQMEDMQSFLSGGMPAMPGMPAATGGAAGGMPMGGMGDIPPEMQQMMAQMMAQNMDPSQMDPAAFMQMMAGAQGGGDMGQGFGAQGFGQQGQNQQQMGYGYGGGGGGGGGSGGGGGGGARNQGGRGRRW